MRAITGPNLPKLGVGTEAGKITTVGCATSLTATRPYQSGATTASVYLLSLVLTATSSPHGLSPNSTSPGTFTYICHLSPHVRLSFIIPSVSSFSFFLFFIDSRLVRSSMASKGGQLVAAFLVLSLLETSISASAAYNLRQPYPKAILVSAPFLFVWSVFIPH